MFWLQVLYFVVMKEYYLDSFGLSYYWSFMVLEMETFSKELNSILQTICRDWRVKNARLFKTGKEQVTSYLLYSA
jgi:hypothetical protein